jgi:hypothetical protein
MAAYTTPERIAAYLGTTFSVEQAAQAAVVADGVTAWIDQRTGRSWQGGGAIADELHLIVTDRIYLNAAPVSAVSSVAVHPGTTHAAWATLAADDALLFDPIRGVVLLPVGYGGYYAQVSYTSTSDGPPADIETAADVLAADLLTTTLNPESAGAESVSVGQNDISVRYAGAGGQQSASVQAAIAAVDMHRLPVIA